MVENKEPAVTGSERTSQVARFLADFLKATFVYPQNHTRVAEPRDALLATLASLPSPLRVQVGSDRLMILGETIELTSPNLIWMKSALDRVLVAEVGMTRELDPRSLLAFADRLRQNFQSVARGATFSNLWFGTFPGIELAERRFQGTFTGGGSESGSSTSVESQASGIFADSAQGRVMLELLEATSGVQAAIEKIANALQARGTPGTETRTCRLLETVVRQMPAETLFDPKRAVATVEQVLAAAARRLAEGEVAPSEDENLVRKLVDDVGRKVFGRNFAPIHQEAPAAAEPGLPGRGRAGDDAIQEDEQAFLCELHALPEMAVEETVDPKEEFEAEQMSIVLHLLESAKSPSEFENLKPPLQRRLEALDPQSLEILRQHLEPGFLKFASAQAKRHATRLLEILRDLGRGEVLITSGAMTVEQVEAGFPSSFNLFLDSLPNDTETASKLLREVCASIGASRIVAAQNLLLSSGLLEKPRIARILATPDADLLPLVQLLVRRCDAATHEQIVTFVRRLNPAIREAAALYAVESADSLPSHYLEALIQALHTGKPATGLAAQAVEILVNFIRASAHKPDRQERRIYAIRRLKEFHTEGTVALLEELSAGRGILGLQGEPKPVRLAAKETLASMARKS